MYAADIDEKSRAKKRDGASPVLRFFGVECSRQTSPVETRLDASPIASREPVFHKTYRKPL